MTYCVKEHSNSLILGFLFYCGRNALALRRMLCNMEDCVMLLNAWVIIY